MNYTLVIQNTITRDVSIYNLENKNYSENIYYKFNISLEDGTIDGEYQYILFRNPDKLQVIVNNTVSLENPVVLVTYNNTLTNGTKILIAGKPINILGTGLIKIGDYDNNSYQYSLENKYISYERK